MRSKVTTGTPWEKRYGYSRALRIGNVIEVSGTVAADENGTPIGETVYEQSRFIFEKIERALAELGASRADVVRTRWYLTDITKVDEAGVAHGEFFAGVGPAATALEISALVGSGFLIEIEVTAIVAD